MYEYKKCDNCNRMLQNGDKVTILIPNVELIGKYKKNNKSFRLKLDNIDYKHIKVYCKECIDVTQYIFKENKNAK